MMSWNNNRYSPAATRNGVIPVDFKFKCRHCKIFKTQDCFSKNEIAPYKHQLSQNPGMKPHAVEPLLRCRGCKGGQLTELQCEGPCSKYKPLDQFSKAQRSRGNKWCMECVQWKEGHHPEVDLTPAPGTEPREFVTTTGASEQTTGSSYAASISGLSQSPSSLAIGNTSNGSQLAPHLRAVARSQIGNRSQSSMSNPFEGARTGDMPVGSDAWSTRDSRRRAGPPIRYNAYDANGVRHSQGRAMTLTSQATSTIGPSSVASITSGRASTDSSGTRPPGTASRPLPASAPVSQPVCVVTNPSTGWAKPIGKRTQQATNPGVTEWAPESNEVYRRSAYDSSDDEM
ncbi:f2acb110-edf3-4cf1-bc4d-fe38f58c9363 [Sclerotinia trifoliorum]|uniref:F2acb110-edf3-4cf1-bc4d-fe38f58c9363 n=1 Tax=Sclerotinia trifoliorum TaxID=28548 RepID=A0A8H2ZKV4_9HELO|nr:f2acb110-edf3-4cf1-bc4d-fe38f58c9363 [Sclerotinia trifoliorum]